MPKVGMEPLRRAQAINAALGCIIEYGMEGLTLERVAMKAGCSKGVVAYYFKNKNNLVIEAFREFLGYYGKKIGQEIQSGMSADDMLEVTLRHSLPEEGENQPQGHGNVNVSDLEGVEQMNLEPEHKAKLFLQFFSRAAVDPKLQAVVAEVYQADIAGIAQIFSYGKLTGQMGTAHPEEAAYGLLAMVVGLSFFRVAGIRAPMNQDNRTIALDYVERLKSK